jgi:hypothetical protein
LELIVRVESESKVAAFISERGETESATIDLVDNVIYQIILDGALTRKPDARTWRGLKHFTDALDRFSAYYRSGDVADLHAARQSCESATRTERCYRKVFTVAYNIGIAYLIEGDAKAHWRHFLQHVRPIRTMPMPSSAWAWHITASVNTGSQ